MQAIPALSTAARRAEICEAKSSVTRDESASNEEKIMSFFQNTQREVDSKLQ